MEARPRRASDSSTLTDLIYNQLAGTAALAATFENEVCRARRASWATWGPLAIYYRPTR
jgi:hypothetical protein